MPLEHAYEDLKKRLEQRADTCRAAPGDRRATENPELELRRKQVYLKLAAGLGARYTAKRLDLDRFEIYHPDQRATIDRIRAIGDRLPELVRQGVGLIWFGTVGTGKDHLMDWLLHQAVGRHGISCRWEFGLDLFGKVRDRMDSGGAEDDFLSQLACPEVLAISDPISPAGNLSTFRVEFLHRLIDRRYRCLKSTWVSMNAANPDDADEQLSAQVFDRLRESAEMFPCFWPSFRERKQRLVG